VSQHASQQIEGLNIANEREVLAHMSHTYGATEAKAIVTAAQAAFKQLPKGVQDYLDQPNPDNTRLTNSPSVLLMLALWGSGHTRLTPEAATKELQRLRTSKEYVACHRHEREDRPRDACRRSAASGSRPRVSRSKRGRTPVT